jgi:hypothetical protein
LRSGRSLCRTSAVSTVPPRPRFAPCPRGPGPVPTPQTPHTPHTPVPSSTERHGCQGAICPSRIALSRLASPANQARLSLLCPSLPEIARRSEGRTLVACTGAISLLLSTKPCRWQLHVKTPSPWTMVTRRRAAVPLTAVGFRSCLATSPESTIQQHSTFYTKRYSYGNSPT